MKKTITLLIFAILLTSSIALAYPTSAIAPVSRQNKQWVVNVAQCSDSDGGKNYFLRGVLASYDPMTGKQIHVSDQCAMSSGIPTKSCAGSNCAVLEASCGGTSGYTVDANYMCPGGCKNGACLPLDRKMSGLSACMEGCGTLQVDCEQKCPSGRYFRGNCLTRCKSDGRVCRDKCPRSARR